jgi:hypothetical protein
MKKFLIVLAIIVSINIHGQNDCNKIDSLLEFAISKSRFDIRPFLADTIFVVDVNGNFRQSVNKKIFLRKYWRKTVKLYRETDFISKVNSECTFIELYNHCNIHKIGISESKIISFDIEFLYSRDKKAENPKCR